MFTGISSEEVRRRVAALQAMGILDTPPEEGFDALTRLAAKVCATPVAVVSLIGEALLWSCNRPQSFAGIALKWRS